MVSSLLRGWLRGWSNGTVERAPGGREADRADGADVQRESPRCRRVGPGRETVERGQTEDRVGRPVQTAPGLIPIRLRSGNERMTSIIRSQRQDAEGRPDRAVRREPGDEERGRADANGRIEHERESVQAHRAEAERGARKRCVSETAAALSARPNGRDLRTSPASTDSVSRKYAVRPLARARIQKVGSLHERPPARRVRPSAVTRTQGMPTHVGLPNGLSLPAR